MNRIALANDELLSEAARVTLSLDAVYLLYGAAIATAALLWVAGVVLFGRGKGDSRRRLPLETTPHDRVTPVIP